MESKAELISNAVRAYRSLAEIPTIGSAEVVGKTPGSEFIKVAAIWNQKNVEQGEISKFKQIFLIRASSSDVVFQSHPNENSTQEFSRISQSDKYTCVIRKTKVDNKKKQFIEIWTHQKLYRNFDVSAFDVHGEIYTDGEFGCLEWSPEEDKILYVAEQKPKKSEPFYKQKSEDDMRFGRGEVVGDEYIFKPDWGEQLVDKHQPVPVVCDINKETIKVIKGIPLTYSPGQLIWGRNGSSIYGVAFDNEPRRLGLVYCTNRPSHIFEMSLTGEYKFLSEADKAVRSPRLSPDGKSLYWLQRSVGGGHHECLQLVKYDCTTATKAVIIDVVRSAGKIFSGLFLQDLPRRCFSKDGNKLFFSTCHKLRNSSYYVNLVNKEVNMLETGVVSSTILDVNEDLVLISVESLQSTPALKISKIKKWETNAPLKLEWSNLTKSETIIPDSVLHELEFHSKNGSQKFEYYNGLYYGPPFQPSATRKVPLVLMPHGGPHSAYTNSYMFDPNFLVKLGYGVLLVNYRGSTGVGQEGVEFLQGKIGDTDVKDCYESLLQVLKTVPYLDDKNVFLSGGSHGGFLVEHLSAQYPGVFRALAARNPVINVSGMYTMSDIPDWATSECGFPFDESVPLTQEQYKKMYASSPIELVDKIKIPTLLLIGRKDLRVPFYEGVKMYYGLKARKVKVRMNMYDDNHTLGNVPNHMDSLINTVIWFLENRSYDASTGVQVKCRMDSINYNRKVFWRITTSVSILLCWKMELFISSYESYSVMTAAEILFTVPLLQL